MFHIQMPKTTCGFSSRGTLKLLMFWDHQEVTLLTACKSATSKLQSRYVLTSQGGLNTVSRSTYVTQPLLLRSGLTILDKVDVTQVWHSS